VKRSRGFPRFSWTAQKYTRGIRRPEIRP
jgi:hypothetical protein